VPIFPFIEKVESLPQIQNLPPGSRHRFSLQVTLMADGTMQSLPVNVLVGQSNGPSLLMVAGVHGDEYEGILAQIELWEELAVEHVNGRLLMVPVANPPAFRSWQRRNPGDMLDMNRVFPGKADGTITEQLAYRLFHEVALKADMVLSMHGWTHGALVVPYVEYPRGAKTSQASEAMARAFGLEYIEAFDWHPGLLVAACTKTGIPAIEIEIGGLSCTLPERRELYKRGVYNLMRHLNMLSGQLELSHQVRLVTRSMLFAKKGGILRRHKELKATVSQGETIATICDLNGVELTTCEAPNDGFIAAQLLTGSVNPGDLIAVIFTPTNDQPRS
jgi:predicted deacylase